MVGGEQVDDEVAEIEEDPAAFGGAFTVAEGDAAGAEVAFEVLDEGVELEWRLCGCDDKVVGERRDPRDVDEGDVERFMLGEHVDGALREVLGTQTRTPARRCGRREW